MLFKSFLMVPLHLAAAFAITLPGGPAPLPTNGVTISPVNINPSIFVSGTTKSITITAIPLPTSIDGLNPGPEVVSTVTVAADTTFQTVVNSNIRPGHSQIFGPREEAVITNGNMRPGHSQLFAREPARVTNHNMRPGHSQLLVRDVEATQIVTIPGPTYTSAGGLFGIVPAPDCFASGNQCRAGSLNEATDTCLCDNPFALTEPAKRDGELTRCPEDFNFCGQFGCQRACPITRREKPVCPAGENYCGQFGCRKYCPITKREDERANCSTGEVYCGQFGCREHCPIIKREDERANCSTGEVYCGQFGCREHCPIIKREDERANCSTGEVYCGQFGCRKFCPTAKRDACPLSYVYCEGLRPGCFPEIVGCNTP